MKRVMKSLFAIALVGLLIVSCEENDEINATSEVAGQLINHSFCKNNLKSSSEFSDFTPDTLSGVEYLYDKDKKKLSLKHINAGFNCCPDSLYCKIAIKGDTIVIQEFEKIAGCNCLCLYDLDIEIDGVEMRTYQIKFIEPYASDQKQIVFDLDLMSSSSGKYSVTRKHYPWGVSLYK
jgi:hypothetical protein